MLGVKGDALQHDRGLAAAGDAVHEQRGHVVVPHDLVLLALDGGRDGLELLGVMALEGTQQKRVLDGHRGVEVHAQLVAHDVVLPAQRELDGAHAVVDLVGGHAHLLVVVGLGDGVAPVHDEGRAVLGGDARRADVDVARRAAGAHDETHLGEVGLVEQQDGAAQLVEGEVVLLVVGVDDRVERLDGGEGLHGLVGAAKVGADLLAHVDEVLAGHPLVDLEVLDDRVVDGLELGIDLAQVRLLLLEDLVMRLCHAVPPPKNVTFYRSTRDGCEG